MGKMRRRLPPAEAAIVETLADVTILPEDRVDPRETLGGAEPRLLTEAEARKRAQSRQWRTAYMHARRDARLRGLPAPDPAEFFPGFTREGGS